MKRTDVWFVLYIVFWLSLMGCLFWFGFFKEYDGHRIVMRQDGLYEVEHRLGLCSWFSFGDTHKDFYEAREAMARAEAFDENWKREKRLKRITIEARP
jgi:hypothetical protein